MTTLISQLTDRRAQVHDAAHNLNERGRTRNLSTAEATEFNSLIADVRMLDDRIAQLRDDQTRNDAAAAAIPTSTGGSSCLRYSTRPSPIPPA